MLLVSYALGLLTAWVLAATLHMEGFTADLADLAFILFSVELVVPLYVVAHRTIPGLLEDTKSVALKHSSIVYALLHTALLQLAKR